MSKETILSDLMNLYIKTEKRKECAKKLFNIEKELKHNDPDSLEKPERPILKEIESKRVILGKVCKDKGYENLYRYDQTFAPFSPPESVEEYAKDIKRVCIAIAFDILTVMALIVIGSVVVAYGGGILDTSLSITIVVASVILPFLLTLIYYLFSKNILKRLRIILPKTGGKEKKKNVNINWRNIF